MDYYSSFLLFVFGLGIGSFLNVASLRYDPRKKLFADAVGGRSHCPYCKKTLRWFELFPVFSFLVQKGKCRSCLAKLSFQYPIVEVLTAAVFVSVPLYIKSPWLAAAWIVIFCLFILLALIDFKFMIIPDGINIALAVLGVVIVFLRNQNLPSLDFQITNSFIGHYALLFGAFPTVLISHIAAALIGMAFFGLIIGLSRGRAMGWGDFKLAGALGLIFGWPDIIIVLALSFITGAVYSLGLMAKKKKGMKDVVPFGPFLVIGSALTFFLGYNIIDAYFKLFGL